MDDLISRQAVLEMAYDMSEIDGEHFTEPHMVVDVADIQKLKPQERTGHWIIMGDRYIKCSECGHITKTESPDIYHFCMVCGANMSEIPTSSKPEISSFYGLKSYVRERSEE